MTAEDWNRRSVWDELKLKHSMVRVAAHLEVLGNLSDESLEGELSDEELSRLLVSSDLSESDGSGPVSVRLLDTTSGGTGGLGRGLSGSLGSDYKSAHVQAQGTRRRTLLSGSLSSGGLSGGLLGSGHCGCVVGWWWGG